MLSLQQIEQDLTAAMKAKDQLALETLRGLKTRVQNEQIAKQKDLTETDLMVLVKSEVKKRKEAAASYVAGNRQELADQESKEAVILEKYLPAQLSEQKIAELIDAVLAENTFAAADFGKAMAAVKAKAGNSADGAVLAKLLKEKLK